MYSLDTNTNTAVERQVSRMHAVRAYNSSPAFQSAAPAETERQPGRMFAKAVAALAAAAPVVLVLVWGLAVR